MTQKAVWIFAGVVLCITLCSPQVRAQGQGVYGAITGSVSDPSGAAVPGAAITVTNIATGVKTSTKSNGEGYYTVVALIAGTYNLEISSPGFKTAVQSNVIVRIDSNVRLDIHLEIGNVSQQIEVTGAPPVLQSEKVEVTQTITSVQLESIPSVHNNATALVALQAGVQVTPGQSALPSVGRDGYVNASVNGGVQQQNVQLLDGTIDTEPIGGAAGVVPPLDSLESVTALTANYDVEFGNSQGLVTTMTTKSGTNQWHFTAYEYNQVNGYSGRNPFTEPLKTSHYVWNQFGGTVGGPIKKNKVFVFGGFQRTPYRSAANTLKTVPTAAFRVGNFSSVPQYPIFDPTTGNPDGTGRTQFQYGGTLNVIPPSQISPVATNIFNLFPLPNNGTGFNNNFLAPVPTFINANTSYGRVDYEINSSNRFFVRYTHNWQNSGCGNLSAFSNGASGANPILALSNCTTAVGSDDLATVDFVHVFSPTFVMEGRFGDMIFRQTVNPYDYSIKQSDAVGLKGLNNCSACGGLAYFIIGGPINATSFGDGNHSINNDGTYSYAGIGTWTKGAHTVKFGGQVLLANDHRRDTSSEGFYGCSNVQTCSGTGFTQTITGAAGVSGSGLGVATFLLGDAAVFGNVIYARDLPTANQKRDDIYIQDTWRVTPKFTAVLGLRYDYVGFPTSPDPAGIANFDFTNTNTILSNFGGIGPTAGTKQNKLNFAPRVGLAYRVTPDTVIRAGYGKTFPIGYYGANFGAITNDWPNATRQDVEQLVSPYVPAVTFAGGVPAFVSGLDLLKAAGNPGEYPTPNSEGFGWDFHNPTNSVDMWNFTVERQIGTKTTVSLAYVGNAVRHLFYRINWNAAYPGPGAITTREAYAAKYNYTAIAFDQSNQESAGYHGLQGHLEKRFSDGYTLTASVTWSKAYDFNESAQAPQDPFNANQDRGPANGERALIINIGHVWNLPFGSGQKFLSSSGAVVNQIVSGWKFSGITSWMSGDPLNVIESNLASLNVGATWTLRPDRKPGGGFVPNPTIAQWWDKTAFSTPAQYKFGNSSRNILRGPSFFQPDWGLARSFRIKEDKRVLFDWQVFNCWNRMNRSDPNMDISSSLAGVITNNMAPVRIMKFGLHLYW
jgi:outer membrane receptor protein involved in Fe transport